MYVVMITGGIGSGKSAVRRLLCEHGAASVDLDEIARVLLQTREPMRAELVDEFGTKILDEDGNVDRAALAAAAFATAEATQAMNAITFPYITTEAAKYLVGPCCVPTTKAPVVAVEVPLLTEVPEFATIADEVIAVEAPSEVRLARCVARGMDAYDVLQRMQQQPTDAARRVVATTICTNAGTEDELAAWVDEWWHEREDAGVFGA